MPEGDPQLTLSKNRNLSNNDGRGTCDVTPRIVAADAKGYGGNRDMDCTKEVCILSLNVPDDNLNHSRLDHFALEFIASIQRKNDHVSPSDIVKTPH